MDGSVDCSVAVISVTAVSNVEPVFCDEPALVSVVTSEVCISGDVSDVDTSVAGWDVLGLIVDSEGGGELSV